MGGLKAPRMARPIGVRAVETMTASTMDNPPDAPRSSILAARAASAL